MGDSADHNDAGCFTSVASEAAKTRSEAPKRGNPDFDHEHARRLEEIFMTRPRLPRESDWDREPDCPWEFPLEPSGPLLIEPDCPDYEPG